MSSKIEVSRELADRLSLPMERTPEYLFAHRDALDELRALLAAPVVELQPFGHLFRLKGPEDRGWNFYSGPLTQESLAAYQVKPVYEAPPELAELQATIARLESKLNRAINLDFQRRETIAQQAAEIERLKGGQGEPVAYAVFAENGNIRCWSRTNTATGLLVAAEDGQPITPLYTSQPAPVSADLSELREYHAKAVYNLKGYADDAGLRDSDIKHYTKRAAFHEGMVALIDKVKELNQ